MDCARSRWAANEQSLETFRFSQRDATQRTECQAQNARVCRPIYRFRGTLEILVLSLSVRHFRWESKSSASPPMKVRVCVSRESHRSSVVSLAIAIDLLWARTRVVTHDRHAVSSTSARERDDHPRPTGTLLPCPRARKIRRSITRRRKRGETREA